MKKALPSGYDSTDGMSIDIITDEIHRALAEIEEVKSIDEIGLVSSIWSPDRMSRYARIALGIDRKKSPQMGIAVIK